MQFRLVGIREEYEKSKKELALTLKVSFFMYWPAADLIIFKS